MPTFNIHYFTTFPYSKIYFLLLVLDSICFIGPLFPDQKFVYKRYFFTTLQHYSLLYTEILNGVSFDPSDNNQTSQLTHLSQAFSAKHIVQQENTLTGSKSISRPYGYYSIAMSSRKNVPSNAMLMNPRNPIK